MKKNLARINNDIKNIVTWKSAGFLSWHSLISFTSASSVDIGLLLILFLQRMKVALFSLSYMLPTVWGFTLSKGVVDLAGMALIFCIAAQCWFRFTSESVDNTSVLGLAEQCAGWQGLLFLTLSLGEPLVCAVCKETQPGRWPELTKKIFHTIKCHVQQ